eukprot:123505-Pyramimonas_sp.AAC.1
MPGHGRQAKLRRHCRSTEVSRIVAGVAREKGNPEADWKRVGHSALASLAYLQRCIAAAGLALHSLQRKDVSRVLRNPDEATKQLWKVWPKSLTAKAVGAVKAKYLPSWEDSTAKAWIHLGLPANASFAKGVPLYKKAKDS